MASERPDKSALSAAAEEAFAQFLAQRSAGTAPDFETFCVARPRLAERLRALHGDWRRVAEVIEHMSIGPSVTELLCDEYGTSIDPRVCLAQPGEPGAEVLQRLATHAPPHARYTVTGAIARGGMGEVYRVWDEDLRRHLAMKVVLPGAPRAPGEPEDERPIDPQKLARFLEEAQITGQLDHPGIVPVHELGLDARGRAYFTMRLVRGESLRAIADKVRAREEGWTLARAVHVLVRVCEAVAYAHSKGVIHRDLKPSNVMVGRFGETYVMDWGLAKVLGADGERGGLAVEPPSEQSATQSAVQTDRMLESEERPGSGHATHDGDVVGTPAYMAPEQARGRVDQLGPRTDVYSVGAMLYHLLTGRRPYVEPGERPSSQAILRAVRRGPPAPVDELAPGLPRELVAICAKAMARRPAQRYGSMLEMADELRAWLEGRVVQAHETGSWAELRKWVRRNEGLAAGVALALVTTIAALAGVSYVQGTGRLAAQAEKRRADDHAREARARAQEAHLALERERVFSDSFLVQDLVDTQERLWPAYPSRVEELETWVALAEELRGREGQHRRTLAELRDRALEYTPVMAAADRARRPDVQAELEEKRAVLRNVESVLSRRDPERHPAMARARPELLLEIAELEQRLRERATWEFDDPQDRWLHAALVNLLGEMGSLDRALERVRGRLDFARSIEERTVAGAEARRRWRDATAAIHAAEPYRGLRLLPQLGLLPLRADPDSGLWEFAHLASGEPPHVDPASGRYAMEPETGIVLVLLPGGTTRLGCEPPSAESPRGSPLVDPQWKAGDGPVQRARVEPLFVSKYEVTQAQWRRLMGFDPSQVRPGASSRAPLAARDCDLRPVERVTWFNAVEAARRWGLALPSEAQWEYACRADTTTPYATGEGPASAHGHGNFADLACLEEVGPLDGWEFETGVDDGFGLTAPVGSFRPNAFGLHDLLGNVCEWTRDGHRTIPSPLERAGRTRHDASLAGEGLDAGAREAVEFADGYVYRGGSWAHPVASNRSAAREWQVPQSELYYLGFRPVLELHR